MGLKYLELQIYITLVNKGKNYRIMEFGNLDSWFLLIVFDIIKLEERKWLSLKSLAFLTLDWQ